MPRSYIREFSQYNPAYINAEVAFYTVEDGERTETLATLYAASTGSAQAENPQRLGSRGMFMSPVYHEDPVIAVVASEGQPSHSTGIIKNIEAAADRAEAAASNIENTYASFAEIESARDEAVAAASQLPKNKFDATLDPSINDDITQGYSAGSRWQNVASEEVFACIDASAGAAVWVTTTLTIDDLGTAASQDVGISVGNIPQVVDVDGSAGLPVLNGSNLTNVGATKNLLINSRGQINQRGYSSGDATSGANQYTIDCWKVLVSGQNISWTESGGTKTFTAPAGGVRQIILGDDIVSGTYRILFDGTATCEIDGVVKESGDTFVLSGGTSATVTFYGGTFSLPAVCEGPSALKKTLAEEWRDCERFYEVLDVQFIIESAGAGINIGQGFAFRERKASPSPIVTGTISNINVSGTGYTSITASGFRVIGTTSGGAGQHGYQATATAKVEL